VSSVDAKTKQKNDFSTNKKSIYHCQVLPYALLSTSFPFHLDATIGLFVFVFQVG